MRAGVEKASTPARIFPHWLGPATVEQVGGLTALMEMGLDNHSRSHRLSVLSVLVGREVLSAKYLTKWEAHTLIDMIREPDVTPWSLSRDGYTLIQGAEREAEAIAERYHDPDPELTAIYGDLPLPGLHETPERVG
ncbi:MAG: hypothetical protein PHQ40_02230 [Anaerolineaceae bacterium]|nr:hypothetical protein [Anaerolineaceae bacterium]